MNSWSTEQGGHGPLVLATGLWAVWRELKARQPELRTGDAIPSLLLLAASLTLLFSARITGILEIEGFAMYGAVVAGAYFIVGGAVMRATWLPLVYLAFALPPPDTVVAAGDPADQDCDLVVGRVRPPCVRPADREFRSDDPGHGAISAARRGSVRRGSIRS